MKTAIFALLCFLSSFACKAQGGIVMYFCGEYKHGKEIHISSSFSVGSLTVMVKSQKAMHLTDVQLEFDRFDSVKNEFVLYKKFDFSLDPEDAYICFSKTKDNDLVISEPGIYRVVLFSQRDKVVTSALVEIVPAKSKRHKMK